MWNLSSYIVGYLGSESTLVSALKMQHENETNFTEDMSYANVSDNFVTNIEEVSVPVICVFGMIGNILSAFVFSHKTLRGNSSSLFLVARSCSDNGFLATLLIIWASSVYNLGLGQLTGICKLLTFLTYFFGCTSVWLVVLVTAENYIRICQPFLVRKLCNTRNARACAITLILLASGIYNFPFWAMGDHCLPKMEFLSFLQAITYADSALTLWVPSTIMATLMFAIAMSTMTSLKRMKQHCTSSGKQSRLTKVTKMLLAVTITFLVLNLPYHAVRLKLMIITFAEKYDTTDTLKTDLSLQSISQLFYYLSMAVNVIIYIAFSSRFRAIIAYTLLRREMNGYTSVAVNRAPIFPMRRADCSLPELQTKRSDNNNFLRVEEMYSLRRFRSSEI